MKLIFSRGFAIDTLWPTNQRKFIFVKCVINWRVLDGIMNQDDLYSLDVAGSTWRNEESQDKEGRQEELLTVVEFFSVSK